MAFYAIAGKSELMLGFRYYEQNRVIEFKSNGNNCFSGKVQGYQRQAHNVTVDLSHPRKCTCDCRSGYQGLCRHKLALAFKADSGLADKYKSESC